MWADFNDVVDAWIGDDVPDDGELVQKWVDKAEREIRFRVPDLLKRIDEESGDDLLNTTIDVVVAMVQRVFRNPRGIRSTSITTGPVAGSETYGGDMPGGLGLTDEELEKLRGVRSTGAFTIDLMPAVSTNDPAWWLEGQRKTGL